jgi:hypothetical protein
MQLPLENINTSWSRDEIAQLIDYAKYLQQENEDMKANVIMMDAKLKNEESKVKQLQLLIAQLTQFTA